MAQHISIKGWLDAGHPGTHRDADTHEFRLRLSEIPLSPWKRHFMDLSRDQRPSANIEQDVLTLNCDLAEIANAIERIKQRVRSVNETTVRQERESEERVARQTRVAEELELKVLAAVKDIRFDEV